MRAQALMAAVLGGKSASVRELLSRGADPEVPNREGITPLHAAAFQNQRDVIEALIEGGADVEVRRPRLRSLLNSIGRRVLRTGLLSALGNCTDTRLACVWTETRP
jgi:ankyrin repeat protein